MTNQRGPVLYDRKYQLVLAPTLNSQTALRYGNSIAGSAALRITFDIKKDCSNKPNPGHIVIYNMSAENRRVVKNGWAIQLQAGYAGQLETIWYGQVGRGIASRNPDLSTSEKASTKREGADISFAIETGEGLGPLTYARFDNNYADGTPLTRVFDDIVASLRAQTAATSFGLDLGSLPKPLPLAKVRRGLSLHGSASQALTKLLKPIGYDWFVSNNQLVVCASNDHTRDGIPVISATTGLLGVPSIENEGVVNITCLLNPRLAPGRLLQLISKDGTFNGYYKCRKVQHKGDTHGEQWDTEIECIRYTSDPSLPLVAPIAS